MREKKARKHHDMKKVFCSHKRKGKKGERLTQLQNFEGKTSNTAASTRSPRRLKGKKWWLWGGLGERARSVIFRFV